MDTSNTFSIRRDGDYVVFSIPGEADGRKFRLDGALPWESAVNFAAWMASQADPAGVEFLRMYNEIKKPAAGITT